MSEKEVLIGKISEAVVAGDEEKVKKLAEEAVSNGIDPAEVIERGLTVGMREVGDRFERGEIFLSHMMISADAMKAGVSILTRAIPPKDRDRIRKTARVVVGTVEGEVYDLGKDVKAMTFVDKAEEYDVKLIAASSLMSVSRPFMKDIVSILKEKGAREKYKVIVGGGAVTREFAEEVGADGYGKDATEAANIARRLLQG